MIKKKRGSVGKRLIRSRTRRASLKSGTRMTKRRKQLGAGRRRTHVRKTGVRRGWDAAAYNRAYDIGFDEAYNEGFNAGYQEGLNMGDEQEHQAG